jgi:hypothetical protein
MALYGASLSKYVPDGCTWGQGTDVCAACEDAAKASYSVFSDWANAKNHGLADAARMAFLNGLDSGQTDQLKSQLDDAYAATLALDQLIQEQGQAGSWDDPMPADYVAKLHGVVANMSSMMSTIDAWFSVSLTGALSDSIIATVGGISGTVANAVSKVAGSFIGGTWWIWLLVGAAFVVSPKLRKVVL